MSSSTSLILPASILSKSPSCIDNIDPVTEARYRAFGAELIQEAGIFLRLPQGVMCTAQTLLQRFYYRMSLKSFDVHVVAMASLFLAGKVEESTRRMRDILNVMYHCKMRRELRCSSDNVSSSSTTTTTTTFAPTPPPLPVLTRQTLTLGGDLYTKWKIDLIRVERFILKELGFAMYNVAEHPHKFILYYVKALGGDSILAQRSWGYLNDSLRTDACTRFSSESIACAALYMAARDIGFPLPKSVPWYTVFSSTLEEILDISAIILQLYTQPKLGWLPSLRPGALPEIDGEMGGSGSGDGSGSSSSGSGSSSSGSNRSSSILGAGGGEGGGGAVGLATKRTASEM